MKILITGILGLFGAHVSRDLLNKGHEIIGIDDCSGGYRDYLDPRVDFFLCDISKADDLNYLFSILKNENRIPNVICQFAAYASEGLSDYIKNYNYTQNIIGSVNVINACINYNVSKLLFTSSMSVYGAGNLPFRESDVLNPVDSYALAKKVVEDELRISFHKFGLRYSIIRPHNVISPQYQNYADKYRNVLAIWANNIVNNKDITVYSDGSQKRSFSDIKFMLPVVEKLLTEFDGEVFNIGSDQPITILDAGLKMQKIARELGYNPNIQHLEARTEVKYAYSSHEKAIKMLGFKDETNLDQVMRDLILWVKDQPKREVRYMDYEITKNMYSYWKR